MRGAEISLRSAASDTDLVPPEALVTLIAVTTDSSAPTAQRLCVNRIRTRPHFRRHRDPSPLDDKPVRRGTAPLRRHNSFQFAIPSDPPGC